VHIDRRGFIAGVTGVTALQHPLNARTQQATRGVSLDVQAIQRGLNDDPEFRLLARGWAAAVQLHIGDRAVALTVRDGRVERVQSGELSRADVTLSAPTAVWREGFGVRGLTVAGDTVAHLWPYYAAIFRLATLVRNANSSATVSEAETPDVDAQFDTAVGRYVYVRIQGVQHRVFFEQAGAGIPLMLQHTAGADSREWRFMLEDRELQSQFRMIAYDLPYHGRSMPPGAVKWWSREYRLTRDLALDSVVAIAHALDAAAGLYLGCAMGGDLALDLALYRPDAFRAVIGINASAGPAPSARDAAAANNASYSHPRVFNNQRIGMMTYGNTSPSAPETHRREVQWIYGQTAPGVLGGDFHYYSIEHDLRDGQARGIDTSKVAVHLVSSEFGPGGASGLASQIAGATYRTIPGAGYLPMTDDYPRFRNAVAPILADESRRLGPAA
jgi:pimeloyl-ACP methyl ester carboxylesterase